MHTLIGAANIYKRGPLVKNCHAYRHDITGVSCQNVYKVLAIVLVDAVNIYFLHTLYIYSP